MRGGPGNPFPSALLVVNNLSEIAAAGAAAQLAARGNLGLGTGDTQQFAYLGLGVARTSGRLQIVSGTTALDAIYFGTDTALYRVSVGALRQHSPTGSTHWLSSSNYNARMHQGDTPGTPADTSGFVICADGILRLATASTVTALTLDGAQKATFASTIKTADPGGGVAEWLIGKVRAGAVALDAANYVEVKIDGTVVKLLKAA